MHKLVVLTSLVLAAGAAAAEEFPAEAQPLAPEQAQARISGKTFLVRLRDGNGWRLEYKANGYFFFNHSKGATDTGQWRMDGTKLCSVGQKMIPASCNEVRFRSEGGPLLKRDNGEVVEFVEKS